MTPQGSSPSELRRFGLVVAAGLSALALFGWFRGHTHGPVVLGTAAGALLLAALVAPRALHGVRRAWLGLAAALAWLNTRVILSVLYYAVFTPVGVIRRAFADPLDLRFRDERSTYWVRRATPPLDPKAYERQF